MGDLGQLPGPTHDLALPSLPPSRTVSIHNFFAEPDPLPDRDLPTAELEVIDALNRALTGADDDDDEEEEEEEDEEEESRVQDLVSPNNLR